MKNQHILINSKKNQIVYGFMNYDFGEWENFPSTVDCVSFKTDTTNVTE